MLQGRSISNLIASIFTVISSSMLVGSPLMDNAAGQIRSTFMQCRAGLPHAKPSWKSVWGKKLNGPRGFMTKSELCALSKRVATSSLVRQQRIGAVAFSLSLARCTIRRREKVRGSRELSSLSLSLSHRHREMHARTSERGRRRARVPFAEMAMAAATAKMQL